MPFLGPRLRCPFCRRQTEAFVCDSRRYAEWIRRRYHCTECDRKFTTYETTEDTDPPAPKEEVMMVGLRRADGSVRMLLDDAARKWVATR